jgi:S-(hydroxymethyl)glutathione dehydrogenase/alcohol dehydrogenase
MIRTRGAILREIPGKFEIVELDLEEPRQGELLIKMAASGLCHSDASVAAGDFHVDKLPTVFGHEGSGVVVQVGPNTPGWSEGDHVVLSANPGCGRCRYCATGKGNLCDLNATLLTGSRFGDPTSFRMYLDGETVGQNCGISTFSEYSTVSVVSAIKIPNEVPLDSACLVGCAVHTGWGSGFNMAQPKPGDTVIVMGVGGIGNFAVQGAAHGGATNVIAVDPVELKRKVALTVGATHAVASIEEATELARSMTNGQGADSAVISVGVLRGEMIAQAFSAIGKGGTVVVTALGENSVGIPIPSAELTLYQKRLQGSMYGGTAPLWDTRKMVGMYQAGQLKLDEVISHRYTLDEITQGYEDMNAGLNVRGVIVY